MKNFNNFQKLLDEQYSWPAVYSFKFIVPRASSEKLLAVVGSPEGVSVRESGKGSYISVTANVMMSSSAGVIAIYEAVADIEGIISL